VAVGHRYGSRIELALVGLQRSQSPAELALVEGVVGRLPFTVGVARWGVPPVDRLPALGATTVFNAKGTIVARLANPTAQALAAALAEAGLGGR